jgi:sugar lactone lactonase YvrE
MKDIPFAPVSDLRLELGEGAACYDGSFLVVDLLAGRLLAVDPAAQTPSPAMRELLQLDDPLGAAAPTDDGGWIIAAGLGVAVSYDASVSWLGRPEAEASTAMRMNDGATDPAGRFWATSMAYDGTPGAGSLYRVDRGGGLRHVLGGLTVPNGPCFSEDGRRMFLADSARGLIFALQVDPSTGDVGEQKVFARVEGGSPDGMTVDDEGFLWSAVWGASCLHRYAPDGELVDVVAVPAQQPTKVAISPSRPGTLLVTTATYGLARPRNHDGRVLAAQVEIAGVMARPYTTSHPSAELRSSTERR